MTVMTNYDLNTMDSLSFIDSLASPVGQAGAVGPAGTLLGPVAHYL